MRAASAEVRQCWKTPCDLRAPSGLGGALSLAGMQVHVFPTSHDAAASFGFRFEAGAPGAADALGLHDRHGCGDRRRATRRCATCRVLALEGNHDAQLLGDRRPYPVPGEAARGLGYAATLSNDAGRSRAGGAVCATRSEQVVALHVSENNNTYRLPQEAFAAVIARNGAAVQVSCGYQRLLTSVG